MIVPTATPTQESAFQWIENLSMSALAICTNPLAEIAVSTPLPPKAGQRGISSHGALSIRH